MRILFASSSFSGGGITSYAHEVISSFALVHEVCVMLGSDKVLPITTPGVKVYYNNLALLTDANLNAVLKIINDDIRPDIIINSHAGAISLLAPYFNDNIKLVTVSHSLKYFEAEIAGMNYKYVDKVIALSHYGKAYLQRRFGMGDEKVDVIYNFVKSHPEADRYLAAKRGNERLKIVFPGGCAPSKTPELALKVVRRLIKTELPFDFYWLGGNMVHLSRYFKFLGLDKINELIDSDPRVHITGKIPRMDADEMIATANVFFFPSRREGCPMSLIEAMRVGAVCVVSDFDNANKEIIRDGIDGCVIDHNNVDACVERINDIICNHEAYEKYYEASRKRYYELLCKEIWLDKMNKSVIDTPVCHVARKNIPGKFALRLEILKYKLSAAICRAWVTIEEDIATLLRFYRLKNKK